MHFGAPPIERDFAMKTTLYASVAVLIAIANPANAQILGGGGGIMGGAPIPSLPNLPTLPPVMNVPTGAIGSVTNGEISGAATASAAKSINTRSGRASANGSANGSGRGSLTQSLDTPLNSVTANGAGSGSASGAARADAQLFGNDAVSGTLHQTLDATGDIVTTFQNRAGNLVTATHERTGELIVATRDRAGNLLSTTQTTAASLTGSAQGSVMGAGAFSGMSHNLALAGTAAADAAGSLDIKSGTTLFDLDGDKIGKVREVFADASGRVKGLLIKVDDTTALLPVNDFAAAGQNLVTAMSESQIEAAGAAQANGGGTGSANGIFSGLSHNLALEGTAAANAAGSLDIKSGTQLFDMAGEKIGKVKQVVADAQGRVKALVVKVEDTTATLPAADFAANGDALVTAMSEGQIVATGNRQASGSSASSSRGSASTKGGSGTN